MIDKKLKAWSMATCAAVHTDAQLALILGASTLAAFDQSLTGHTICLHLFLEATSGKSLLLAIAASMWDSATALVGNCGSETPMRLRQRVSAGNIAILDDVVQGDQQLRDALLVQVADGALQTITKPRGGKAIATAAPAVCRVLITAGDTSLVATQPALNMRLVELCRAGGTTYQPAIMDALVVPGAAGAAIHRYIDAVGKAEIVSRMYLPLVDRLSELTRTARPLGYTDSCMRLVAMWAAIMTGVAINDIALLTHSTSYAVEATVVTALRRQFKFFGQ